MDAPAGRRPGAGDMTSCAEVRSVMHGLLDGELDPANALRCEEHLTGCPECASEYRTFQALRRAIRTGDASHPAPEALRSRVLQALDAEAERPRLPAAGRPAPARPLGRWIAAGSALALAASLTLFVAVPLRGPDLENELVSGHVRSLLADHLTDIKTSDQHVVKPWFAGKLDFSPPVVDLASSGFPLVGGRLEYLSGRVIAALVFRRGEHAINLFIAPAADKGPAALRSDTLSRDGYHILHWTAGGMSFWAVSDLNAAELHEFATRWQAETRS
ncbi:MAG: anti-sigma factor family protein [Microvirga sp.]